MIISPPLYRSKTATETEAAWIERMMPVDNERKFPMNKESDWHGGVHITDNGKSVESVRAIADGKVVFVRKPVGLETRNKSPYHGSDSGCVVLRHETKIGENVTVTFFSLYMHLKSIDSKVQQNSDVRRKAPLGAVGQIDGRRNAIHFQIFCDEANLVKLVGRKAQKLDISKDGRTDVVYGDMHFYLPSGTKFYRRRPAGNSPTPREEAESTPSKEELFVTMSFAKGKCTMTTRKHAGNELYVTVGAPIPNDNYVYNLYKEAVKLYPQSPSAGYEMLRFGRVINTDHEKLSPTDAPHWREVNHPDGRGWVNLANADKDEKNKVKKFSDADFPHWMGWQLIDDDRDANSQCDSGILQAHVKHKVDLSYMICHFPFEWNGRTAASRLNWVTSKDKDEQIKHIEALSIDTGGLSLDSKGEVWHFDPRRFITHFRKCLWIDKAIVNEIMSYEVPSSGLAEVKLACEKYYAAINKIMLKYLMNTSIRQAHFLGQGAIETDRLRGMQEYSGKKESKKPESELGHWYGAIPSEKDPYYSKTRNYSWKIGNCGDEDAQKFRGRGMKMLTGRANYADYWVYRGWLSRKSFTNYWWDDQLYKDKNTKEINKKAAIINDPHKITGDAYCCIDTGALFIVKNSTILTIMDEDTWHEPANKQNQTAEKNIIKGVTNVINGGETALDDRVTLTRKAKDLLS